MLEYGCKTLILVDNSASVSAANREITKETLKYLIRNAPEGSDFALATFTEQTELLVNYGSEEEAYLEAVDKIGYPEKSTCLTDVVMSTLKSVAGRLEPIRSKEGVTAIVDYAHTPDALENVLNAIHEVLDGKGGQVITVCGAGGNRDKGKRPLMAQEAAKQSDRVIITSDNPRFEEPQDIINDMLEGLNAQQEKKTISIVDRKEAIRTATMMANKGDVILIAGKGHEDYQEIKGVKHHFDDREIVREIFENE